MNLHHSFVPNFSLSQTRFSISPKIFRSSHLENSIAAGSWSNFGKTTFIIANLVREAGLPSLWLIIPDLRNHPKLHRPSARLQNAPMQSEISAAGLWKKMLPLIKNSPFLYLGDWRRSMKLYVNYINLRAKRGKVCWQRFSAVSHIFVCVYFCVSLTSNLLRISRKIKSENWLSGCCYSYCLFTAWA